MYKLTLDYYDLSVLTTHLAALSKGYKNEVVVLDYLPPNKFRIRIFNQAVEIIAYGYWPDKVYTSQLIISLMKRALRTMVNKMDILYFDNKLYFGPLFIKAYTLASDARCEDEPLSCLVKIQTDFTS